MNAPGGSQPYKGALPRPTPETRPFWDGAREGRLMLPWCEDCGKAHYYPRSFCPHCFSARIEWRQASGRGRIYSYVINHKAARGYEDKVPYVIAVVTLDEGPRVLTTLVMDVEPTPENVQVEMPVEALFDPVTPEISLVRFKPAGDNP